MSHPINTKPVQPAVEAKESLDYNPILDTDSYKLSHWNQYPADTTYMMSYLESRGGQFAESTLFGLQYLLHEYLSDRYRVGSVEINEAEDFATAHGDPFNRAGWEYIRDTYNGAIPVTIRAIPEGTVVPVGNALLTIECHDPKCFWLVSYLETMLSRLWYPSTIAIQSRESKKVLKDFLDRSSDTPEADLPYKLHDFGARGVSSLEQSRLGGAAHLLSFMGSDTLEGTRFANHYYDCDMSSFSIPAAEHSTVSSWGREHEKDFYRHFVKTYLTDRQLPPGVPKLAACVSDTYNVFEAVKFWCSPEMRQILKDSGGTLVIRPDSGDPVETLSKIFILLGELLQDEITLNSKKHWVLPSYLRVIQGDGINLDMMKKILHRVVNVLGWSATNIAFGSGGGLLQQVNRDTQKFAFKCCAIKRDGKVVEVFKDPITDQGKRSKSGRLDLVKRDGVYETVKIPDSLSRHPDSVLETVFHNGNILFHNTLAECRARMSI
jgi:nicotinamide phosphoribosyltransferase